MQNIRYLITSSAAILSYPFLIVNEFKNCLREERIHDPHRQVLLLSNQRSDRVSIDPAVAACPASRFGFLNVIQSTVK